MKAMKVLLLVMVLVLYGKFLIFECEAADTTAPTVTIFTIPSTSNSLTVSITTFTATDNVGVTGYLVNESATKPSASISGWRVTKPTSYTFSSAGSKTLYAWAKDAAGNLSSSKSATVIITLTDTKKPKLAGDQPSAFISAFNKRQPIKIEEGASLYVIGWRTVDKKKAIYEFALNFVAEPKPDGALPKIKGVSLYIFSAQPESMVQISYENANQWVHISAYEPQSADQIIDEHGGPNSFYGLGYAWLVGTSFIDVTHDLGVIFLKTSATNRLKFIIETYVLSD